MSSSDENRWQQRLESFAKALHQLEAACALGRYTDLERAGLTQLFSLSYELAWKTLKDLLYYEGFEARTPREAIRQSFQAGYLAEADTETLLDVLHQRNVLAHIYDKDNAMKAEEMIRTRYAPVLQRLHTFLQKRHYDDP